MQNHPLNNFFAKQPCWLSCWTSQTTLPSRTGHISEQVSTVIENGWVEQSPIQQYPPFYPKVTGCSSSGKNILLPFLFSEFRPNKLEHLLTHHNYSQVVRERCFLDLCDSLNPAEASICPYDHWLWLHH